MNNGIGLGTKTEILYEVAYAMAIPRAQPHLIANVSIVLKVWRKDDVPPLKQWSITSAIFWTKKSAIWSDPAVKSSVWPTLIVMAETG